MRQFTISIFNESSTSKKIELFGSNKNRTEQNFSLPMGVRIASTHIDGEKSSYAILLAKSEQNPFVIESVEQGWEDHKLPINRSWFCKGELEAMAGKKITKDTVILFTIYPQSYHNLTFKIKMKKVTGTPIAKAAAQLLHDLKECRLTPAAEESVKKLRKLIKGTAGLKKQTSKPK